MTEHRISRRTFFYGPLLTAAIPAGGFGSVASLRSLGYKPYYDKLNVASIGCGGQGGFILNEAARTENIVALCEVDDRRGAANLKKFSVPRYKDYRVMLDKEGRNIDACTIGIPDFMHAAAALACMQRGKHVYVEKPLTTTPWEARLLRQAAEKYGVATQMGNQGFSHECHRVAAEIVWSGEIGEVREAHISVSPGTHPTGLESPPPAAPVPEGLDWDLWLGVAPTRPYSSMYTPYNWRGFWDFGTGQIGNWATHTAGPVHSALLLDAPVSVECLSQEGDRRYAMPHRGVIRFDFPARGKMPPCSVYYHDAARPGDREAFAVPGMEGETILPPTNNLAEKGRPTAARGPGPLMATAPRGQLKPGEVVGAGGPGVAVFLPPGGRGGGAQPGLLTGNGSVFIGTKGVIATSSRGEGVWLLPSSRWKDYALPPPLLTRSPGHMLDWIRACKGGSPSCSDFRATVPFAEWLALVLIAYRVPGKLAWDSRNLRFTNSPEANRYVKPLYRKGRELKL